MKSYRQGGRCPAARARAHAPVLPIAERTALSCPRPVIEPMRPRAVAPPAASWDAWTDLDRWTLVETGGADVR